LIIVQTPLRVSLFGGGTDFPAFFMNEGGGCVLSTTIDKYIFVIIKQRFDKLLRVGYTRTEIVDKVDEIQHELIRETFRKTGIKQGVEITTMGDIPSAGTGLGSSSTVTVGSLNAMYNFLGEITTAERLAREACEIEIDVLKKPIGVQDQYIVSYGGLRFIEFTPNGNITLEKISLDSHVKRQLNNNLLLFFTGITRRSDRILTEQNNNTHKNKAILCEMKQMTYEVRDNLRNGNIDIIGTMLNESWQLKKQLAREITNVDIDAMYQSALNAGAIGGKITGAGGGGFLLIYCHPGKQESVRDALHPLQELPFHLESDGTKVIFNYRR